MCYTLLPVHAKWYYIAKAYPVLVVVPNPIFFNNSTLTWLYGAIFIPPSFGKFVGARIKKFFYVARAMNMKFDWFYK